MKKDNNKEITQIDYNYLKLPEQITLTNGRWIKYDYDAGGTKLRKTLSTGKVTDYEEDDIYEDGVLYQTTHDEGRIVGGVYEYNITDHLGNLRVAFKDSLGIAKAVQYENRGAWGESLEGIGFSKPNKNRYSYSTYENQEDFGINVFDAYARMYDATAPRFWQIDPLAEISRRFSPYSFSFDNPLRFTDPDGMQAKDITLLGANNSSVTVKTDLIDIKVNASGLGLDFGGNYTLSGNDILGAALDVVGIFDPTGIADGLNAGLQANSGDYLGAAISAVGVIPYAGDLAKVGKIEKDVKIIGNAVDALKTGLKEGDKLAGTSKAARREAMRDAGIPTSQPLIPDKATKSGDKVFLTRDGKSTVQNATNDVSHQGQPHWEAGPAKPNINAPDGLNRSGNNNKPQMGKPKSKVYYNE